jgi:hypothetical protein
MEPGLGVYAGYSLGGRDTFLSGDPLKPHVQDALDELEYCLGDANTKWGARRIQDGHPAPFKINFVEIDNAENRGVSYERRYVQFRDAIKARYPRMQVISAVAEAPKIGEGTVPDVQDDHHYRRAGEDCGDDVQGGRPGLRFHPDFLAVFRQRAHSEGQVMPVPEYYSQCSMREETYCSDRGIDYTLPRGCLPQGKARATRRISNDTRGASHKALGQEALGPSGCGAFGVWRCGPLGYSTPGGCALACASPDAKIARHRV